MKKIQSHIFSGISDPEWEAMLACNCMRREHFEKGKTIFHTGEKIYVIGIVLSGMVNIEHIDYWGNKSLLNHISKGQLFGESYALRGETVMVNAVTAEPSEILFLDLELITHARFSGQSFHDKLLRNLLAISLQKNIMLANRIFCTTPKTIRGRLLIYLSEESAKAGSATFQIPFNRQELADYLNLDRSALSKELGKMQKEGLLAFHKNHFTIL